MTVSIKQSNPPYLLGVAGGSGSGKTHFARALLDRLGSDVCEILYQDFFYLDQSERFDFDGGAVNFDHPDSIDFGSLATALQSLKKGTSVDIPVYDFATHKRKKEKLCIAPKALIVVDGILILHSPAVSQILDERLFFDTPEEIRFQRRLERDVQERGRLPAGVRTQFYRQVKPMHDQFVEPSKSFADAVIDDEGKFDSAVEKFVVKFIGKFIGKFG